MVDFAVLELENEQFFCHSRSKARSYRDVDYTRRLPPISGGCVRPSHIQLVVLLLRFSLSVDLLLESGTFHFTTYLDKNPFSFFFGFFLGKKKGFVRLH
jgi:hypothetical protein